MATLWRKSKGRAAEQREFAFMKEAKLFPLFVTRLPQAPSLADTKQQTKTPKEKP
jgi:hypothetical protein